MILQMLAQVLDLGREYRYLNLCRTRIMLVGPVLLNDLLFLLSGEHRDVFLCHHIRESGDASTRLQDAVISIIWAEPYPINLQLSRTHRVNRGAWQGTRSTLPYTHGDTRSPLGSRCLPAASGNGQTPRSADVRSLPRVPEPLHASDRSEAHRRRHRCGNPCI